LATPTQALIPRWLVVAVIVMGLLLVVGVFAVGSEISRRLSTPKPAPSVTAAQPFTQKIELPAGAQVISMTTVGDRLVVQVENQAGLTSAYIVDPRTGTLLGTIEFPSGAPR
jgi:uncharacterized membrane protein